MQYIPLLEGNLLCVGDEQRDKPDPHKKVKIDWSGNRFAEWRPLSRPLHTILASDLCHLEFRRPLP